MTTKRSHESAPVRFRTALELGALIREEREAQHWTQGQLAERADVGRQWLSAIESGRHSRAEVGMLMRVLAALDIELYARSARREVPATRSAPSAEADMSTPPVDLDSLLDAITTDG